METKNCYMFISNTIKFLGRFIVIMGFYGKPKRKELYCEIYVFGIEGISFYFKQEVSFSLADHLPGELSRDDIFSWANKQAKSIIIGQREKA